MLGIFVLLALDAVYILVTLERATRGGVDDLKQAKQALAEGDLAAAEELLSSAHADASAAAQAGWHPAFLIARATPGIATDARALFDIARAEERIAQAGLQLIAGVNAVGGEDDLRDAIYSQNRFDIAALEAITPYFAEAELLLREAGDMLAATAPPGIGFIEEGLDIARGEVANASSTAHKARVLFEGLPRMLGASGQRRYFLAFEASGTARGSGGQVGLFGILTAEGGRLRLRDVGGIGPFVRKKFPPVRASEWFENHYRNFGSLHEIQQANASPHFPESAEVVLRMYESATGKDADGVISMDPTALGELTRGVGTLPARGLGERVTPESAERLLLHDFYLRFRGTRQQNAFLTSLVRSFWSRLGSGDVDVSGLARGLATAVGQGHFKMYSRDETDQTMLAALEANRDLSGVGPTLQMVFHNNAAANKVDYFLRRKVATTVVIDEQGNAYVTVAVTMRNDAPSAPRSQLLGPGIKGDAVGLNRMFLNLIAPHDAVVKSVRVDGRRREPFIAAELEYPAVYDIIEISSGGQAHVLFEYRWKGAVDLETSDPRFTLTLVPQSMINPDDFSIAVTPPPGYSLEGEGDVDTGQGFRLGGTLLTEQSLSIAVRRD